jgi:hypothetical protein
MLEPHFLAVDIQCVANSHRYTRKIAEPLLERQLKTEALYQADRNVCDRSLIENFVSHQFLSIIRQHGVCPSRREISGEERVGKGTEDQG